MDTIFVGSRDVHTHSRRSSSVVLCRVVSVVSTLSTYVLITIVWRWINDVSCVALLAQVTESRALYVGDVSRSKKDIRPR